MPNSRAKLKISAQPTSAVRPQPLGSVAQGTVVAIRSDGLIDVHCPDGNTLACAWLENSGNHGVVLAPGDAVLLTRHSEDASPVVMGRIGRYGQPTARVELEAGQTLSLKCGASSMELRADGKVLIKGEDVTVRAKGTQRIRAGTVSIN